MTEQQPQIENRQSEMGSVFDRIRQRIDEMRSEAHGHVDPQALARKLAERAKVLRGRVGKAEPAGPQISFLAFCHGPQRYGIPISDIIEVKPLRDYTPVPATPRFIPGVIHWRGAILSLVDLVQLFGIAESGLIDERSCVVVEAAGQRVAILAGEVEDLITAPLADVKSAPDLPVGVPSEWVIGVYDENRLLLRVEGIVQDERLANWRATGF
jgi:purine-binding chemotaxis protein CheW